MVGLSASFSGGVLLVARAPEVGLWEAWLHSHQIAGLAESDRRQTRSHASRSGIEAEITSHQGGWCYPGQPSAREFLRPEAGTQPPIGMLR